MSEQIQHLLAMIVYILAVIGIGVHFARRANKSSEDTGIGDRVGSVESGKDGDVVIWTADPLTTVGARAAVTIINGCVVHKS